MNHANGASSDECQPADELCEVMGYLRSRGISQNGKSLDILESLLYLSIYAGRERLSVRRAAALMYVSRRTLGRWCEQGNIPHPSAILAFGRVLATMRILRATGWSIARAAESTKWSDAFTFSNTMHRLTGLRPSVGRSKGLIFIAEAWVSKEVSEGSICVRPTTTPSCPSCGSPVEIRH